MTGKQLKNSILQWAIQGKLVPQDPNDEPASVLLEKIRQEKERLIKEKKIKRDKNASIIYRGEDNLLIIGIVLTSEDDRCVFVALDFLLFDQAFFLLAYLFEQYACRFVVGVLGHQFSLYGPLQYAVF